MCVIEAHHGGIHAPSIPAALARPPASQTYLLKVLSSSLRYSRREVTLTREHGIDCGHQVGGQATFEHHRVGARRQRRVGDRAFIVHREHQHLRTWARATTRPSRPFRSPAESDMSMVSRARRCVRSSCNSRARRRRSSSWAVSSRPLRPAASFSALRRRTRCSSSEVIKAACSRTIAALPASPVGVAPTATAAGNAPRHPLAVATRECPSAGVRASRRQAPRSPHSRRR